MIRFLSGKLLFKDLNAACVDTGGVGYQVRMPLQDLAVIGDPGDDVKVHIHTHVREGAIELFGFGRPEALAVFEKLITISGIGPKSAIALLSGLDVEDLLVAVQSGDEAKLTKAPGIGKKMAARIILELKDKLAKDGILAGGAHTMSPSGSRGLLGDLESALENLGYKPAQVDKALDAVRPLIDEGADLSRLVREALKHV